MKSAPGRSQVMTSTADSAPVSASLEAAEGTAARRGGSDCWAGVGTGFATSAAAPAAPFRKLRRPTVYFLDVIGRPLAYVTPADSPHGCEVRTYPLAKYNAVARSSSDLVISGGRP